MLEPDRESDDRPTEQLTAVSADGGERGGAVSGDQSVTSGDGPHVAPGDPAGAPEGEGDAAPRRSRRGLLATLIVLGVLLIGAVAAYLIDLGVTSGEIERGTSIAGVEVGGLTPEQATAALTAQVIPQYRQPAQLTVNGGSVALDPQQAGLSADIDGAVAAAGTRSASPAARIRSFFRSENVPVHVTVDRQALQKWVSSVAAQKAIKPVEGSVTLTGTKITVVKPVTGVSLDQAKAADLIAAAWAKGGPQAVSGLALPVTSTPVRASAAGVAAAQQRLAAVLSGPITVDAGGTALPTIGVDRIAAATTVKPDGKDGFVVTTDIPALRKPLTEAAEATKLTSKDATIGLVDGRPQITDSVTGRVVNWQTSERALAAVVGKAAVKGQPRTWTIAYTTSEPDFTTAEAKALGLKEVIGEFTTGGFAWASGQNVKVVAEKVNGAIVMPGKTFSLNTFTGPRTAEQGYIEAGVIENGRPAKAVGGGISQFATTLYNAAYFAGMGDVTHTPHSYYISRYPMGREATVFDGEIDLAFSNDYPTAVLIQTIWTENDITVRIWGTKHVQIESETSEPFDYTSVPQITIPYGQECSPQSGTQGSTVINYRIFKDLSGKEIKREKYTTVYNGQQHIICAPPPQPDPTPTPQPNPQPSPQPTPQPSPQPNPGSTSATQPGGTAPATPN